MQIDRQRIDKWLWHARTVRTRAAAAAIAQSGHVRLNGRRITNASQPVRLGDIVTLALDRSVRVLRVEGFMSKRGGAPSVRGLYCELSGEPVARDPKAGSLRGLNLTGEQARLRT